MEALEAYPPFQQAGTVLLYYSLPDEVCTHDFIRKWCDRKRLLLPVVVGDDLELRCFTGPADMAVGAAGHRLGRGKGYYDRLLPHLRAVKVGICYPYQLLAEVPAEPFDVRMDAVVSGK